MKKLLSVLVIILLTAVVSVFGTLFVLDMVDNEADVATSDNTEVIDSADGEEEEILPNEADIEEKEPLTIPDVEPEPDPEVEVEAQPEESYKSEETEEIPDIIKLPEHIRPKGYDNPVLTEEVALEIMREAREMQLRILFGGVNEEGFDYWYRNCDYIFVQIKPCDYTFQDDFGYRIIYYVPGLDTFEKFYDYFLPTFTEMSLVNAVSYCDIYEYDGKLAGSLPMGYSGYILETDWSRTELVELKQDTENGTARVQIKIYHDKLPECPDPCPHSVIEEYNLVYSEKYGWRVDIENIHDIV